MELKPKLSLAVMITMVVLLLFSVPCLAAAASDAAVISVNGEGIVKVVPDRAEVTFAVVTEGENAAEAQNKNAALVKQAVNTLQNGGVAQEDINTRGYYLNPMYNYPEGQSPTISSYEARNELIVNAHYIENVGKIIDLAVQGGINQVQDISFYVEDSKAPNAQALNMAIADARYKADIIAAALDKQITGIQSASGYWYNNSSMPYYAEYDDAGSELSSNIVVSTPINPGMMEIFASADIVYFIN